MHVATWGISLSLLLAHRCALSAQAQESRFQAGTRIRINACTPNCHWRHEASLVAWTADFVVISEDQATVSLPWSAVDTVEVEVPHAFDGRGAAWGAAIGAAALFGLSEASGVWAGDRRSLAVGAGLGALFGGGGSSSRRGAGVELTTGAGIGAIAGALYCSGPDEGFLDCAPEEGAGVMALVAGGIGAAIGVVVGTMDRHRWQRVSTDRLRVTPVATLDGRSGLAASGEVLTLLPTLVPPFILSPALKAIACWDQHAGGLSHPAA